MESEKNRIEADVVIVGSGVSGTFCALTLPEHVKVTVITKSDLESSDSFLCARMSCRRNARGHR